MLQSFYRTALGQQFVGDSQAILARIPQGSTTLVIANLPPNCDLGVCSKIGRILKPDGHLVLSLRGRPDALVKAMSLLGAPFRVAEDFYWPAAGASGLLRRAQIETYWWITQKVIPLRPTRTVYDACCPMIDICPLRTETCRAEASVASYFISALTAPRDLVVDTHSGSNITGFVAEQIGRRWLSIEANTECATASRVRFRRRVAF